MGSSRRLPEREADCAAGARNLHLILILLGQTLAMKPAHDDVTAGANGRPAWIHWAICRLILLQMESTHQSKATRTKEVERDVDDDEVSNRDPPPLEQPREVAIGTKRLLLVISGRNTFS